MVISGSGMVISGRWFGNQWSAGMVISGSGMVISGRWYGNQW